MGLLGMRERVAALRGRMSFDVGRDGGSALRVVIPLAAAERQVLEHAA
jgi:signal transduction histidine kinase